MTDRDRPRGAGTVLKVGGTNPARSAEKFFWKCPPTFGQCPSLSGARTLSVVCMRPLHITIAWSRFWQWDSLIGIVLKMSLFAGLLTVLHKILVTEKIHDLNYVGVRGFIEANFLCWYVYIITFLWRSGGSWILLPEGHWGCHIWGMGAKYYWDSYGFYSTYSSLQQVLRRGICPWPHIKPPLL